MDKSLTIIILAAGASTRFNGNKLEYTLPPIIRTLNSLSIRVSKVRVVCRQSTAQQVEPLLANLYLTHEVLINAKADEGMGSSIASAFEDLGTDTAMVILGDMPLVSLGLIERIHAMSDANSIVAPLFTGNTRYPEFKNNKRRGHPVCFGRNFFRKLTELKGDIGAKELLKNQKDSVKILETDDIGAIVDIDTQMEMEKWSEQIRAIG